MKTPKDIIKEHISCTCDEMYKRRKLADPDCVYCEWADEIELMMDECAKQAFEAANKQLVKVSPEGVVYCNNKYSDFEDYKNSLK